MKNWILCSPVDRQTIGSMRYILETCQRVKDYTHGRIFLGDRKNNRKPIEELISEWLSDYLRLHRAAEDVPRYALKDAMREVLVNGISVHPRERKDYLAYTVEPRAGWKKKSEGRKSLSWTDFLDGKTTEKTEDNRTVSPDVSIQALFENGLVSFRWGRVRLRGGYVKKLQAQASKRGIDEVDFLRKVKEIDFMRMGEGWEAWKISFRLE